MKAYLLLGALLFALGTAWYYTNKWKDDEIASLLYENITHETSIKNLEEGINKSNETITNLRQSYDKILTDYKNLEIEFNMYRKNGNEVNEKLDRHDLNSLALAKPELIENIINNASANALRCFELLSGAPKNAKELAATTDSEFNSECPWLR